MFIQTQPTPNPETIKFLPGQPVSPDESREFRLGEDLSNSPLASVLCSIEGVARVYFGPDFITVTKSGVAHDWQHLKAPILAAIMDHFTSAQPLYLSDTIPPSDATEKYSSETAQIVDEIKTLLDTRIRPAVAQDGGDIVFDRFDSATGVVYLHMRGACAGCPSSAATLKSGVENMLRHYVPEVNRVEQSL